MRSNLCPFLISLSFGSLLVGCASKPAGNDLLTSFIHNDKMVKAIAIPPVPSLVAAASSVPDADQKDKTYYTFSFQSFGDSVWADSQMSRPSHANDFQQAYGRLTPIALLGDIIYRHQKPAQTTSASASTWWAWQATTALIACARPKVSAPSRPTAH
jgi:hypothetical protein